LSGDYRSLPSSFVRSFVRSDVRSFVATFVRSLRRSFVRSLRCSLVRSDVRSFVRSDVRSFAPTFARSFVPTFVPTFRPEFVATFHPEFVRQFRVRTFTYLPTAFARCVRSSLAHLLLKLVQSRVLVLVLRDREESCCCATCGDVVTFTWLQLSAARQSAFRDSEAVSLTYSLPWAHHTVS